MKNPKNEGQLTAAPEGEAAPITEAPTFESVEHKLGEPFTGASEIAYPADHAATPITTKVEGGRSLQTTDFGVTWNEVKTPDEWLAAINPELWKHAVAAQMHGWAEHAHHADTPIDLTREAYLGAIEAAAPSGDKFSGTYAPHPKALSQHAPSAKKGNAQ